MNRFWSNFAHVALASANVAQMWSGLIPPPYNLIVMAAIGTVHLVVNDQAAKSDPVTGQKLPNV
jgi:hypothetical protein